jgi:hypothetical protein
MAPAALFCGNVSGKNVNRSTIIIYIRCLRVLLDTSALITCLNPPQQRALFFFRPFWLIDVFLSIPAAPL